MGDPYPRNMTNPISDAELAELRRVVKQQKAGFPTRWQADVLCKTTLMRHAPALLDEIEQLRAELANRPDSDPHTETLWEGETTGYTFAHDDKSWVPMHEDIPVPPGTRVRVVRDKDQP